MTIFITVDDGNDSVEIKLTYRWWVPGSDPWRATVAGKLDADKGDWFFSGVGSTGTAQISGVPRGGSTSRIILELPMSRGDAGRIQVGDSGTGLHAANVGTIGGPITWTVTNIA